MQGREHIVLERFFLFNVPGEGMSSDGKKTGVQTFLFSIALVLSLVTIVSLPFALRSVLKDIRHPDHEALEFTPKEITPGSSYSRLDVGVTGVDEVNHTAFLRVSGFHSCAAECGTYTDKVVFYQVDEDDTHQDSMPSSEAITLPNSSAEVSAKMSLPLRGSVLMYPFDKYRLGLGVVVERVSADKTVRILTPEETKGQLLITLDEQVARLDMGHLRIVNPATVKPSKAPFDYAYVALLDFERPVFLQIVVSMVVVLTVAVAIFTMLTRPFDQLVINAGAVILGIFGARSLVLQGFPADVTLVDTVFALVVLYNLLTLTFRGMNFFHRNAKMNILPWAKPEEEKPKPEQKDCPDCLSKIPKAAKRCAFCTAVQAHS